MKTDREDLLQSLEAAQPGLSSKDIMEQSSCFVFQDGIVTTYNEEIACRNKVKLDITGAVKAEPLLAILRKLPEETLEIANGEGELYIRGTRRELGVRMEEEILLPIETIESPGKWRKLPEEFIEAVSIVEQCASRDKSQFVWTCVHVHGNWIEACDNYQLSRYELETGVKDPCLIRRDSLRHVVSLDVTECSETKSWIHFRNASGVVISCRRYVDEYHDLSGLLDVRGEPTVLPKGLVEAVDKAEVFSAENTDDNLVTVELRPGKLRITGEGVFGWYREMKKLQYDGKTIAFRIAPKLLVELVSRHNECEISDNRLKVDGGRFVYIANLRKIED